VGGALVDAGARLAEGLAGGAVAPGLAAVVGVAFGVGGTEDEQATIIMKTAERPARAG
jgi:hypothetical protein